MNRLRQSIQHSPLVAFAAALFVAGAILGATASAWIGSRSASQLRSDLAEAQGREVALTSVLRSMVENESDPVQVAKLTGPDITVAALPSVLAASQPAFPISSPTPTSAIVRPAPSIAERYPKTGNDKPANQVQPRAHVGPAPQALARTAAPAMPVPRAVPPATTDTSTAKSVVTPTATQALPAASNPAPALAPAPSRPSNAPFQAVSAAKAEIAGLDKAWVKMNSGLVVHIGDKFPSGETLVSVDPVKGQIVTDRRVLLIL
jgi:hypothetical protein